MSTPSSGQQFFLRQYKLTVDTYGGDTIEIPDLRFTFKTEKKIERSYQFGEFTIYNLSANTETDILQNGKSVTLEAGYQNGPYGLIFKGPIRQPIRGKEDSVTYFLKLLCIDNDDALNLGFCNNVLIAGQTAQQIASQVARSSTVPFDIKIDPNLSQQQTQRGKVLFGQPKDYLRSMALNNDAGFYFNNGTANISKLSQSPPAVVSELNASSGLIGMPQQVDQGIQVRCLINPTIDIDTWFHLNNQDIILQQVDFGVPQTLLDLDGLYRVISITAIGDTRGNDWYFDINALSQAGAVPLMLTDPTQSGM